VSRRIVEVEFPEGVLFEINEAGLHDLAREALFVRLYERGLLSSGRAARLLGLTRWDFLDLLGRYGVSYFDDDVDLAAEVRHAE
jgi:predicted HTH domain antitoxin